MDLFNLAVFKHSPDHYTFQLEQCEVYSINIINFVQCQIVTDDQNFILSINTGSFYSNGYEHNFNIDDITSLIPLAHLIGAFCVHLDADETGQLTAEFSNGDSLRPPDNDYENWEFVIQQSASNWIVGSSPGGGFWVVAP